MNRQQGASSPLAPAPPGSGELTGFGQLVGRSRRMRELFDRCERLADSGESVLLRGESGTGKDALARAIHARSARAARSMVVVDCSSLVGVALEAELFGHEKAALPGASSPRAGAFERAEHGTLLLDELSELSLDLQPKLLAALTTRRFCRVGSHEQRTADVRVLAASKRDLEAEVRRGKLSGELLALFDPNQLELPALRERRDDIPVLVTHLLDRLDDRATQGEPALHVPREVLDALASHDWPGNVRELRNVLERALHSTRAAGETSLVMALLPAASPRSAAESARPDDELEPGLSYREQRARFEQRFERRYVTWLLERHEGNVAAAARAADMDRKYLHKLAKRHGLKD